MTPDDDSRFADYVERVLADWPPLTEAQRAKLAELLRPVRVPLAASDDRAGGQR